MPGSERIPFVALLLAAGSGSRLASDVPKPYLELGGRTLLEWSARRLAAVPGHEGTVAAVDAESRTTRMPALRAALSAAGVRAGVTGGMTRQESCALAWRAARDLAAAAACVVVHDCARPFFPRDGLRTALAAAREHGGAILGHFARDTLKRVGGDGRVAETLPRDEVFHAATPQVFRRDAFERMLAWADEHGAGGTDESALAEACGVPVVAVPCAATNLKITYPEDLVLARGLVELLEDHDD